MTPALPEHAVPLEWWDEEGATLGMCDMGGFCLLYGLSSDGPSSKVAELVKRAERRARALGYGALHLDSSHKRLIETALRTGWRFKTMILEKTL